MKSLRRTIHPVCKILDEKTGLAEFTASDETIDSYKEIVRASGWKFNRVQKNFPFVDSHDYSTIEKCLGKVVDFAVTGRQLMNTVQYAIEVQENRLAQLAWKMLVAKMLPAVSVGFIPVAYATKWDSDPKLFNSQLVDMKLSPAKADVNCIYIEQEQIELSQCVIGANPNAVARCYKAGAIDDADLDFLSTEQAKRATADAADSPAAAASARQRAQKRFLMGFQLAIKKI
jgi:hypothetical protein